MSLFDSDYWMILLSNKDQCLNKGLGATYVKPISNYIQYNQNHLWRLYPSYQKWSGIMCIFDISTGIATENISIGSL